MRLFHRRLVGNTPKRRLRSRRLAVAGVLVVFVAMLIIGLGWPGAPGQAGKAQISVQPTKKLFGVGERPVVKVAVHTLPRVSLFAPMVYADDIPQVDVKYNSTPITEATHITPDGSGYDITLGDQQTPPKAGTYNVTVSGTTSTGQAYKQQTSFAWGALAVNSDKSVYAPGETAELQLGVVGSEGNTICNAPLQLTITDPNGQAVVVPITNSPACRGDSYSAAPDYTASYTTTVAGTYTVLAGIANTAYNIRDSFQVATTVPFDVARAGLTRLFPSLPYTMTLNVQVNQAFSGQVRELLPDAGFRVTSTSPSATVTTSDHGQLLTWHVDWPAGTEQQLSYNFDPPPASPAFYQLPPAEFVDASGATVFKEARGWQYVNDATITLVSNTLFNVASTTSTTKSISATTTGDLLVVLYGENATGTSPGLGAVSDNSSSPTNTWVLPNGNPSPTAPAKDPPANSASGVSSEIAMAYVANASSITSITVTVRGGVANAFSFIIAEFSNVDPGAPVDQSASTNDAASTSHTTPSVTNVTCDAPTTDQLLRGGEFFCTDPHELVIGIIEAGSGTCVSPSPCAVTVNGNTCTAIGGAGPCFFFTQMDLNSSTVKANSAYQVISTTQANSITWNPISSSKASGMGIMVFKQAGSPSGGDEQYIFWAK
ncbi:MAG TPA: hypothetical protein VLE99_03395 [Candidatus Saccharimonadales bacterium]|nr:hypothetical protein [Candidatus Saccharimonadales bacterium]